MKKITLLILIFILSVLSCKSDEADDSREILIMENQLKQLELEINEIINISCDDDNQCMTIAFGSKPCGGPWTYLIFSKSTTDTDLLQTKVKQFNEIQNTLNIKIGLISDCAIEAKPKVGCETGNCEKIEL